MGRTLVSKFERIVLIGDFYLGNFQGKACFFLTLLHFLSLVILFFVTS